MLNLYLASCLLDFIGPGFHPMHAGSKPSIFCGTPKKRGWLVLENPATKIHIFLIYWMTMPKGENSHAFLGKTMLETTASLQLKLQGYEVSDRVSDNHQPGPTVAKADHGTP